MCSGDSSKQPNGCHEQKQTTHSRLHIATMTALGQKSVITSSSNCKRVVRMRHCKRNKPAMTTCERNKGPGTCSPDSCRLISAPVAGSLVPFDPGNKGETQTSNTRDERKTRHRNTMN